jgi:hypothetical protein
VTGLIVGAKYKPHAMLAGVVAMVVAHVKPIAINYVMCVNHVSTNAVKTIKIHCWWYDEIIRIDTAQGNSDSPHAYIVVVNEVSQRLFSSLTLSIRLSQRVLVPLQQWYTAA